MNVLGRKLSFRNGFGKVIYYNEKDYIDKLPPSIRDDPNVMLCHELHYLITDITLAEEAAIRQITPLISIVRLTHGNIATKGTTHCVWQQSKLNTVLPNLPSECCYVLIKWKSNKKDKNKESSLKS